MAEVVDFDRYRRSKEGLATSKKVLPIVQDILDSEPADLRVCLFGAASRLVDLIQQGELTARSARVWLRMHLAMRGEPGYKSRAAKQKRLLPRLCIEIEDMAISL